LRDELPDDLVLAEPERWYERRQVELITGRLVAELDPTGRVATLDDGTRIAFDRCLLATGAAPRPLGVPGGDVALLLRTLADSRRLRATALAAGPGAPVTVIGGGFIGVEVASALAALGLRPTIVEMAPHLWGGLLGTQLAGWGAARLAGAGVAVRHGVAATRLDADAAWIGEERLAHSFAVAGIGVWPRVELGQRAGLATDDGIRADAAQRTSHPAIWAAGDVARAGERRVEHWHAAREAGERAALSMLDLPLPAHRAPWIFSEVGGVALDVIGDARGWDEERWLREDAVLAYLDAGRVAQLAVIGSALDPATARGLIERGASVHEVEQAVLGG
jgi:3-phenylpropionate/trans-cinnamate dioxygenase ferredoxin reductase subunit